MQINLDPLGSTDWYTFFQGFGMAQLALRLRIFVASPMDVLQERAIVEEEVRELSHDAQMDNILLETFRWETDAIPGVGRPQGLLLPVLEESELIVAIFWSQLGSPSSVGSTETGFLEELRVGFEQVKDGQTDNVYLYNKTEAATDGSQLQAVTAFKQRLKSSKTCVISEFSNSDQFRKEFARHLRRWYRNWRGLATICRRGLLSARPPLPPGMGGEDRFELLRRCYDFTSNATLIRELGRLSVANWQKHSPVFTDLEISKQKLSEISPNWQSALGSTGPGSLPKPLVSRSSTTVGLAHQEWYHLFCAYGLMEAIQTNQTSAVSEVRYRNSIHQLLRILGKPNLPQLAPTLVSWLHQGGPQNRPIVRDFAAFVLGMLEVKEAADHLALAAVNDSDSQVRLYSILSLINLRSRKHVPLLLKIYENSDDESLRKYIAWGICYIIGLCHFQM